MESREGMPVRLGKRLLAWASDLDEPTVEQARRTSRLPVIEGHVALMPDAHLGIGATIGSVIPTRDAVIPSAVGVDIGCGMVAVRTDVTEDRLPDDLTRLLPLIARAVPAGMGKGHARPPRAANEWLAANPPPGDLTDKQVKTALSQFGTLGSGNHFFEVCLDESGLLWVVLHSGSRGIGNQLATEHIKNAKRLMKEAMTRIDDPDLAYFVQGTPAFERYVADMLWAQRYAMSNRARMMDAALVAITGFLGFGRETRRINCHHNFAVREEHGGKTIWVTRKGAIRAEKGDLGVIPGSMGARTFIVRGKGNSLSYNSCSHGAGRRMSRTQARKTITVEQLAREMEGRVWNVERAHVLLDEGPAAYKDIDQVMRDQRDLVEVVHELRGILNYKGN